MFPGVNGQAALVRNAADPRQNRRAEQEVRRRDGRFLDLTRTLLESPEFREWLHDVVDRLGVRAPIFDASKIHYLEGRRQAGLELLGACMTASPDLAAKAEIEQIRRTVSVQRTVAAIAASHQPEEGVAE